MRSIAVVTVGRSDWGIYQSLLAALRRRVDVRLKILASGMHVSPAFGMTVRRVEAAFPGIVERVEMDLSEDTPEKIGVAIGAGVSGFAKSFARERPDIVVVLGDRFEMFSAAAAAVPFLLPIAHLHGGERTEGAIDEQLRHAITKLSHLHFVAAEAYAVRVRQLGEEPWRVIVAGAPALDTLSTQAPLAVDELARRLGGFEVTRPFLLCTFHAVTLEPTEVEAQGNALLAALDRVNLPVLFTMPNADPGGRVLRAQLTAFCAARPQHRLVETLGFEAYGSILRYAAAMVGNSSSGLIEAPSFGLPVVNVGTRQDGRVRAKNVIDVAANVDAIAQAIRVALNPDTRASLAGLVNPYGGGNAGERIAAVLAEVPIGDKLVRKHFVDIGGLDAAS